MTSHKKEPYCICEQESESSKNKNRSVYPDAQADLSIHSIQIQAFSG